MRWFVCVIIKFLKTHEFWATLIGVFIAFMLSYSYDRHIRHKEEVRNSIESMQTIKVELEENLKHIGDIKGENLALLVRFSTVAMNSSISSGRFALFDVELQSDLAKIYRNFRYAEMYTDKLLQMTGSVDMAVKGSGQVQQEFQSFLIKAEDSLRNQIPQAVKLLEEKINVQKGN
ncbi:MAG: hypothetical protein HY890_02340 [Deltaproteobacteria bacterium]|nr:hypothetical protein [Deltaproteobacteria bacterium]